MVKPLAVDLFCGLGGWAHGLLAEGWDVIGFDVEAHCYDGERYPAQLVIQDVMTLHGSQFRSANLIVASPPCQAYSYRAMPWKRAKALPPPDNTLFEACFRIQREACEAAGRHIPLIVENVRGAQKWVGRSRWNFGSYHLWGDVPALMPMAGSMGIKLGGMNWVHPSDPRHVRGQGFNTKYDQKHRRTAFGNGARFTSDEGRKGFAPRFADTPHCRFYSTSPARARARARAQISKIPLHLAKHIGRVFKP